MGLIRRVLVFLVALAGIIDGGFILGVTLAAWLAPGPLIGYLSISLLLLGAAVGAALAATIGANVLFRTGRGRYLPVLAVTAIAGVVLAVAQVWLVQHLLDQPFRTPLLLASVILIALIATAATTIFRSPVSGPGLKISAVMIGVIVVIVILAILLSAFVYFASLAFSTFS